MDTVKIKELTDIILKAAVVKKIILFGSHARKESTRDSDFDILIVLADDTDKRETGEYAYFGS